MLRSDEFFEKLDKRLKSTCYKTDVIKQYCEEINEKYDIPMGLMSDYFTLRVPSDAANDFILYVLYTTYFKNANIDEYFSKSEINKFSKMKFQKQKLKFPLSFNMIEVKSNQWIGRITAQELMKFRDAQIINYNENTQRTLRRQTYNGNEVWKIAINDLAVKEIVASYEEDSYIPNTITLNIPETEETDFYYDYEEYKLVVKSLKYFDILDGYHRYLALSKVHTKNSNFDYEMELRIVNFSEEHARHFIWQEDQKTKMSRVDSESYNQSDYSVYIAERIAGSMTHGIISRNKGIIDLPEFAIAIRYFFRTERMKRSDAMKKSEVIKNKLDALISEDPSIIDKRWDKIMVDSVVCVLSQRQTELLRYSKLLYEEIYQRENYDYYGIHAFNARKATLFNEALKKIEERG